jgi:hypothetical protein
VSNELRLKKQLSTQHTKQLAHPHVSRRTGEMTASFLLTINKRPMKEAVEFRVDVVAASHVTMTLLLSLSSSLDTLIHPTCLINVLNLK